MANTLDEVTISALRLPSRQRLALAGYLLESTDASEDSKVDEAWEREILQRIRSVDAGGASGIPWEQALQEADNRLAP